jgi:hypothetical protein
MHVLVRFMLPKNRNQALRIPSIAGTGLSERMRSTTFALLGLAAAAGLGLVAIFAQPGWPLLSPAPPPTIPAQGPVANAVALGHGPKHTAIARRTSATAAGGGVGASGGAGSVPGSRTHPALGVPTPIPSTPSGGVARHPASDAAPAPAPASAPSPEAVPTAAPAPEPAPVPSAPEKAARASSSPPGHSTAGTPSNSDRSRGNSGSAPGHASRAPHGSAGASTHGSSPPAAPSVPSTGPPAASPGQGPPATPPGQSGAGGKGNSGK